jgi:putative colanic acid biosynthesis UDP-glucose lipid carrier transferase
MQEHVAWKSRNISETVPQHRQDPSVRATRFAPLSEWERFAKRSTDVSLAFAALVFLLPFLLLVAAAIFIESGGPVIFRQKRGGLHGRPFTIWKFRTMRVLENGEAVTQAQKLDPRVTRLGAVLRKTSIDELPQLWNVVRGDMSIVGPRPHALAHDRYYSELIAGYATRQFVKPGLTGLAQVEGCRGETSSINDMARRVELDIRYIAQWSYWLDVKIIARTAITVLFEKDVY